MKIAIASNDETTIADHFGKARGFLIFDIRDGEISQQQFRMNNFTGHARGMQKVDHNIDRHGPILEALNDCNVVISRGMGQRIYNDLRNTGIQTLIVDENNAETALRLFMAKKLNDNPEKSCNH